MRFILLCILGYGFVAFYLLCHACEFRFDRIRDSILYAIGKTKAGASAWVENRRCFICARKWSEYWFDDPVGQWHRICRNCDSSGRSAR